MKYRKKPVEIMAHRNTGDWPSTYKFLHECAQGDVVKTFGHRPPMIQNHDGSLDIHTLEGTMRAAVGDWIICGVQDELYPCKPDIFEATYERVESEDEQTIQ